MIEDKLPSKKHVQVPNNMTDNDELEPRDLLVYATIKKYVNYQTNETFVGLEKISEDSGYAIPTIRKSIEILKNKNYITVTKKGRSNLYKFNPYKKFEPFSYDFLDRKDLAANEKAYIIASQQYMFKNIEGMGKITYDNERHGQILNLSGKTVQRLDKSLIDKGYLNIIQTSAVDGSTGLKINEKIFYLNELEQAVIWTLQKHDEKINEHDTRLDTLEKQLKIVLKENTELKKENEDLKKSSEDNELIII
jgi:predicted transcriptional regulator